MANCWSDYVIKFIGTMKKLFRRLIKIVGVLVVLSVLLVLYANMKVLSYQSQIVSDYSKLTTTTVGMVFAGGVSQMTEDRMKVGVELYKKGMVKQLLLTGDGGGNVIDETDGMYQYAAMHGVVLDDIIVDPYGYHTITSCERAGKVYHLNKVIAVSQVFHLPRIIYLCDYFGVETVGVPAEFHLSGWPKNKNSIREALARFKAFIEIEILRGYK